MNLLFVSMFTDYAFLLCSNSCCIREAVIFVFEAYFVAMILSVTGCRWEWVSCDNVSLSRFSQIIGIDSLPYYFLL